MTTSFARLSNGTVLYHSSSTFIVAKTCSHHQLSVVTDHLAGLPYVTKIWRKKNKHKVRKWRIAHARCTVHFHGAGGGWQHRLKQGCRPARASQLTNFVANARLSTLIPRRFQCPHSRVIKIPRVLIKNGNLRSVQTC